MLISGNWKSVLHLQMWQFPQINPSYPQSMSTWLSLIKYPLSPNLVVIFMNPCNLIPLSTTITCKVHYKTDYCYSITILQSADKLSLAFAQNKHDIITRSSSVVTINRPPTLLHSPYHVLPPYVWNYLLISAFLRRLPVASQSHFKPVGHIAKLDSGVYHLVLM